MLPRVALLSCAAHLLSAAAACADPTIQEILDCLKHFKLPAEPEVGHCATWLALDTGRRGTVCKSDAAVYSGSCNLGQLHLALFLGRVEPGHNLDAPALRL